MHAEEFLVGTLLTEFMSLQIHKLKQVHRKPTLPHYSLLLTRILTHNVPTQLNILQTEISVLTESNVN